MFGTYIPIQPTRLGAWSRKGSPAMPFALTLALVLVLSSAYLFHQWYSGDMS